ncbi:SMP-30/gluconolactonase/LRE family protein [Cereibacter sphaeroides]|uniref:SMP-30/gluconolactonase/LRE family protein n=1 Tax=Cereibacter sphaeroides TaxID=1063 RepID=UPI000E5B3322|nr:SMP-30/gluconolactonase/LRE family protein [Cereibacter sphaeroides]RHZ99084.1 SMP-30/gluconolactonase/LRE family protein [Cereibacter sphaeroides]
MSWEVFDPRVCGLGEGPLWHPERQQFFWFDILGRRLLGEGGAAWTFDRAVTAAGWIDRDRLLVATETGLAVLDLRTRALDPLLAVEADRPETRSNDGRADRQGGFWFSTMGKEAQSGAGSLYRFHHGCLERLVEGLTIPNAICFAPDGRTAYYSDTARQLVWTQRLDAEGWPVGERELFLDLTDEGLNPDGAVIDAEGGFCCAAWGAGAVLRFDAGGRQTHRLAVGGRQPSCPAFGGPEFDRLLVTTATEGMEDPGPDEGLPYLLRPGLRGLAEPRVTM